MEQGTTWVSAGHQVTICNSSSFEAFITDYGLQYGYMNNEILKLIDTAAGLRACKPAIICPFFGDQPFWGRRVAELGVGPRPIPQKKLTACNLAEAIEFVTSDLNIKQRAEALSLKIRSEDGIAAGIDFLGLNG